MLLLAQVGLIQSDMKPDERREAYSCDVTYVTNSELGFDYLRDNLATVRGLSYVQRQDECGCKDMAGWGSFRLLQR